MARSSPQAGRREAEVCCAVCAVASPCVVSSASCVVAAVASLGSGSLGSALGSDCAVGAIVPCRPPLVGASDSAGSTTSDLRRSSGKRAGGRAMWRVRHQWTTSQARNGKESRAARIHHRARGTDASTARCALVRQVSPPHHSRRRVRVTEGKSGQGTNAPRGRAVRLGKRTFSSRAAKETRRAASS